MKGSICPDARRTAERQQDGALDHASAHARAVAELSEHLRRPVRPPALAAKSEIVRLASDFHPLERVAEVGRVRGDSSQCSVGGGDA